MERAPLFLLYLNVLVIATCGLVYELIAGTLASYLLGDSVTQFSLVIGIYLFAMGVGAWLSRFVRTGLARVFIEVELGVALLGGFSAPLLFFSFANLGWFHIVLYGLVFAIGTLVGLELPLLMRILKEHLDFSELVSRVLAFDYIGALAASLLFPIFLVPHLGLVRTSMVFGMLNGLVGLWGTWLLQPILSRRLQGLRGRAVLVLGLLTAGLIKADTLTSLGEESLFSNPVVYAKSSPYQRIVVTQGPTGFQLFLNGNLQFNSVDEYRYHEALVHPAMLVARQPKRVLVLGGGDGLAVREVLKHSSVENMTLVDLDPEMTALPLRFPPLAKLNRNALDDKRVRVVHEDAMIWLEDNREQFDAAIIDFPDPNTYSLGKLYTTRFYRLLKNSLTSDAPVGIQCTSPVVAKNSYWCIVQTLEAAGFHVWPYHAAVPSFGVWGYALARATSNSISSTSPDESDFSLNESWVIPSALQQDLLFLNDRTLAGMFELPQDFAPVKTEVNRLDNQVLVRYYEHEWRRWE